MAVNIRKICYILGIAALLLAAVWGFCHLQDSPESQETSAQISGQKVYASGEPVGIYLKTKGLLVLGTQEVKGEDGRIYHPCQNKLESGDYILKCNGEEVVTKSGFISALQKNKQDDLILTVSRKGKESKIKITPVYSAETKTWQIGAWLRNNTQGIGTLTYVTASGEYGALGHCISDYDLGVFMELEEGSVYKTSISSILKGKKGSPGEAIGSISYTPDQYLGSITENTVHGIKGKITGHLEEYTDTTPMETAKASEIKDGKALLRTSISGEVKDYTVNIKRNQHQTKDKQKSLTVDITDKELLKLTGGIVQGLSGSPLIQNHKLVGAVTHVLVDQPRKGYGIYIEEMLQ